AQNLPKSYLLLGANVYQQDVLRSGQPNLRLELLNNPPQTGFELVAVNILYSPVLDEQTQEIIPVGLLMPPEQVPLSGEVEWARRLKLDSSTLFDFDTEPLDAAIFQDILEPGVLA